MAKRAVDTSSLSDGVGIYLDEVAAHSLLSAEDEVRLAKAMEEGRRAQVELDSRGDELSPAMLDTALIGELDKASKTAEAASL